MEEVFIKILKRWWKLKQPIKFNNIEFLKIYTCLPLRFNIKNCATSRFKHASFPFILPSNRYHLTLIQHYRLFLFLILSWSEFQSGPRVCFKFSLNARTRRRILPLIKVYTRSNWVSSQVIQSLILDWDNHDASKLWNVKVIISEFERWSFIYSPSSQAENYNRIWHLI